MRIIKTRANESVVACQRRNVPEEGDKEWVIIRSVVKGQNVDVRVCLEKKRSATLIIQLK